MYKHLMWGGVKKVETDSSQHTSCKHKRLTVQAETQAIHFKFNKKKLICALLNIEVSAVSVLRHYKNPARQKCDQFIYLTCFEQADWFEASKLNYFCRCPATLIIL